ncbi:hypothetical protein [Actinopolymorpha sp. B9G3]|uniref:hypothetical protein n=1 Tax=Actinopolymorpha sp. B9G3 TaxID=3158970 RepID=UPI0032D8FDB6
MKTMVARLPWEVLVAAAIVAPLVYVVLGLGRGPGDREFVEEQLTDGLHGLPIVLPVELPDGYSPPSWYHSEGHSVRTAWFVGFDTFDFGVFGDDPPPVELCIQRADSNSRRCAGTSGSRPSPEAERGLHVERQVGAIRVVVNPLVDPPNIVESDLNAWDDVEFTTDLDTVTWLR